jgi:hypothetical protein
MDKIYFSAGPYFINLTRVTYAEKEGSTLHVFFSAPDKPISLSGDDATRFERRLNELHG